MNVEELFEAKKNKTLAVIVTGNPKYIKNNPKAKRYYNDIKKYLKRSGIGKVEFDPGKDFTSPRSDADLVIGHSKGVDRLRFVDPSTPTLAFGALDGIIHPKDAAFQMNNPPPLPDGVEPVDEHYEFTAEQRMAIDKAITKINKGK